MGTSTSSLGTVLYLIKHPLWSTEEQSWLQQVRCTLLTSLFSVTISLTTSQRAAQICWICKHSVTLLTHKNTHAHTKPSLSYLWTEEPWLQPVQTVLSNWAMSLYTQGNHPLLMKKWNLLQTSWPWAGTKKKKEKTYFERLMQLETSHTQTLVGKNQNAFGIKY